MSTPPDSSSSISRPTAVIETSNDQETAQSLSLHHEHAVGHVPWSAPVFGSATHDEDQISATTLDRLREQGLVRQSHVPVLRKLLKAIPKFSNVAQRSWHHRWILRSIPGYERWPDALPGNLPSILQTEHLGVRSIEKNLFGLARFVRNAHHVGERDSSRGGPRAERDDAIMDALVSYTVLHTEQSRAVASEELLSAGTQAQALLLAPLLSAFPMLRDDVELHQEEGDNWGKSAASHRSQALVDTGVADVVSLINSGRKPFNRRHWEEVLCIAICCQHLEAVQGLLRKAGLNLDWQDADGCSPALWAKFFFEGAEREWDHVDSRGDVDDERRSHAAKSLEVAGLIQGFCIQYRQSLKKLEPRLRFFSAISHLEDHAVQPEPVNSNRGYSMEIPLVTVGSGEGMLVTAGRIQSVMTGNRLAATQGAESMTEFLGKDPQKKSVFVSDGAYNVALDVYATARTVISDEFRGGAVGILSIIHKPRKRLAEQDLSLTICLARDLYASSAEPVYYMFPIPTERETAGPTDEPAAEGSQPRDSVELIHPGTQIDFEFIGVGETEKTINRCVVEKLWRRVHIRGGAFNYLSNAQHISELGDLHRVRRRLAPLLRPNPVVGMEGEDAFQHGVEIASDDGQVLARITTMGEAVRISGVPTLYEYAVRKGARGSFINVKGVSEEDSEEKRNILLGLAGDPRVRDLCLRDCTGTGRAR